MPIFLADTPPTHELGAELAFDSTFVARARYARGLPSVLGTPQDLQAGVTLTLPLFATTSSVSDGQVALDVRGLLWHATPWGVEAVAGTALSWSEDAGGRALAWSAEARLRPGFVGPSGRLLLDLGWRPTLATHLRHSALTRDLFADRYPDPTVGTVGPLDGWYSATSGRLHLGLTGAWRHAGGAYVEAGGGWSRLAGPLPAFADIGVLPFYTHLQGGWQW